MKAILNRSISIIKSNLINSHIKFYYSQNFDTFYVIKLNYRS